MTIEATDDFARADANPADGGWVTASGFSALQILGGELRPTLSDSDQGAYFGDVAWEDDQWSEITYGADMGDGGPAVRISTSQKRMYWAIAASSTSVRIAKHGSSGYQELDFFTVDGIFTGDVLAISAIGDVISAYVNGEFVGSVIDTDIATGKAGANAYAASTRFSNWRGGFGDYAAGGLELTGSKVEYDTATTATHKITTTGTDGTIYSVATTSSTKPSESQVKAGQDHTGAPATWFDDLAISSAGEKTFNVTGLTYGGTYYLHDMHELADTTQSPVETSRAFLLITPGAVDFGRTNDASRYYSYADAQDFDFITGEDWCFGFWFRIPEWGANSFSYIFSIGFYNDNGFFQIGVGKPDVGNGLASRLFAVGRDSDGTQIGGDDPEGGGYPYFVGETDLETAQDYFAVVQRRGDDCEMYLVPFGTTATIDKSWDAATAGYGARTRPSGEPALIGQRGDLAGNRSWQYVVGEFFVLLDDSLSSSEVTTIAAGAHINSIRATRALDLRFRALNDPEPDESGSGRDFDQVGSGFALVPEFFPDSTTTDADFAASVTADATLSIVVTNPVSFSASTSSTSALSETANAQLALTGSATAIQSILISAGIAFAAAGSATALLADQETASVSITGNTTATASFTDLVVAALGLIAAGNATSSTGNAENAPEQFTAAGTGNALLDAIAAVAQSITAALSAGETWADHCAAIIAHVESGNSLATFAAETQGLTQKVFSASTAASDQFVDNIAIISPLTASGSAQATIVGTLIAIASITATGSSAGAFAGLVNSARVALSASAPISNSFAAALDVHAALINSGAATAVLAPLTSIINSISAAANANSQFTNGVVDIHPLDIAEAISAVSAFGVLEQIVAAMNGTGSANNVFAVAASVSESILFAAAATAHFVPFTGDKGIILLSAISLRAAILATQSSIKPAIHSAAVNVAAAIQLTDESLRGQSNEK